MKASIAQNLNLCLLIQYWAGLLGLLLMKLGEGIGKELINQAFGQTEKGKWIKCASQLKLGMGSLDLIICAFVLE